MNTIKHDADGKTVVIRDVDTAIFLALENGLNSKEAMIKDVKARLTAEHGERMPSFAQYSGYTDALSQQIRDKGYSKSSNHFHVTFRECFTQLFGAIPVSMDDDARRKYLGRLELNERVLYDKALAAAKAEKKPVDVQTALAVRAVKTAKKQPKQTTAGAPKGETQEHPTNEKETIEQIIVRYGMFKILDGIVRTLNEKESTKGKAKALASLTAQLAREMKPCEVKPAEVVQKAA